MLDPKSFRGRPGTPKSVRQEPLSDVVRLRVVLLEVIPPVWRRVQVPSSLTLRRLHFILQCVMGLKDAEAHQFRVGTTLYGKTDTSDPRKDSRWVTVGDVASLETTVFFYELGEGGRWEHEIRIEGFAEGTHDNQRPVCMAGERAFPPPDVGGPDAYVEYLAALKEPYRRASGEIAGTPNRKFDPEHFDLEAVNRALAWLR